MMITIALNLLLILRLLLTTAHSYNLNFIHVLSEFQKVTFIYFHFQFIFFMVLIATVIVNILFIIDTTNRLRNNQQTIFSQINPLSGKYLFLLIT